MNFPELANKINEDETLFYTVVITLAVAALINYAIVIKRLRHRDQHNADTDEEKAK